HSFRSGLLNGISNADDTGIAPIHSDVDDGISARPHLRLFCGHCGIADSGAAAKSWPADRHLSSFDLAGYALTGGRAEFSNWEQLESALGGGFHYSGSDWMFTQLLQACGEKQKLRLLDAWCR